MVYLKDHAFDCYRSSLNYYVDPVILYRSFKKHDIHPEFLLSPKAIRETIWGCAEYFKI